MNKVDRMTLMFMLAVLLVMIVFLCGALAVEGNKTGVFFSFLLAMSLTGNILLLGDKK